MVRSEVSENIMINVHLLKWSLCADICNDSANMQLKVRIMLKLNLNPESPEETYGIPSVRTITQTKLHSLALLMSIALLTYCDLECLLLIIGSVGSS
eukprot:SAG31_NODE_1577_length_7836_cov_3.212744_5_plen_97_part_00